MEYSTRNKNSCFLLLFYKGVTRYAPPDKILNVASDLYGFASGCSVYDTMCLTEILKDIHV